MKLNLISVNALPRSGTTMVMKVLSSGENVGLGDQYPYEIRLAAYFATVLRFIKNDSLEYNSWQFEDEIKINKLAAFPYDGFEDVKKWKVEAMYEEFALACRRSLIRYINKNMGGVLFWAEKFPGEHQEHFENIFNNVYFLSIIRNPISVAVSRFIMAEYDPDFFHTRAPIEVIFSNTLNESYNLYQSHYFENNNNPKIKKILIRYESFFDNPDALKKIIKKHIPQIAMPACEKNFSDLQVSHSSKRFETNPVDLKKTIINGLGKKQLHLLDYLGYGIR